MWKKKNNFVLKEVKNTKKNVGFEIKTLNERLLEI